MQVYHGNKGNDFIRRTKPVKSGKQAKTMKEQLMRRKQVSHHSLPPVPKPKKSMKNCHIVKEVTPPVASPVTDQHQKKLLQSLTPISVLDKADAAFDLNQDSGPSSLPNRALIFDLNELSTGDDDLQSNVESVGEAKKSLIRGLNDEQQNDLKLSICRNSVEDSSCVGKRKISWQDPVAFKV